MLTPRQIRIKKRLLDQLQTLRYTSKRDDERAAEVMAQIIDEIDEIVEGEIDLATAVRPRNKR
jgi:hypothetical protein